jgi:hypothetical protein
MSGITVDGGATAALSPFSGLTNGNHYALLREGEGKSPLPEVYLSDWKRLWDHSEPVAVRH